MKINWMLLAGVAPYLSVLAYDVWLHVNHRKVPPKERGALVYHCLIWSFLSHLFLDCTALL